MSTVFSKLTITELMDAAESWGPFPIPPCTLNSIELASIGFPCYGKTGVIHRVCDAPCHVSALDEDGVDTGIPCSTRWVVQLAAIMPSDLTSQWHCGRQGHKVNAAHLVVCQEVSCPITQSRLPEVSAALWALSLQACQKFQLVQAEAVLSDCPTEDLLYQIIHSCGVHKVGPLSAGSNPLGCTDCKESGLSNVGSAEKAADPGSNDSDMAGVDYEYPPVPSLTEKPSNIEQQVDHLQMRRDLRGNFSDRLWPQTSGSTYLSDHELLGVALIAGMPDKLHSCRLRPDEIKDACGCYIMLRAMDNNAVHGNPIITQLPKKLSSQPRDVLEARLAKLHKLADLPVTHETKNGNKIESHVSFRFDTVNSNGELTNKGDGGTSGTMPKTFHVDAFGMLQAMQGMVSAMTSTSRSFNPLALADNCLKNVEKKRKGATVGGPAKRRRSNQLPSTDCNSEPVTAPLVSDVDHSVNSNNRNEKSSSSFKIPRVCPGQGNNTGAVRGGINQLTTQGQRNQPPYAASNSANTSYSQQNQRRGSQGQHRGNYRNQGAHTVTCNSLYRGLPCNRRIEAHMNFCPSCGSNTRINTSTQSGQIRPLHRGGARGSNRGYRGRGTGRGGTGAHRGNKN